MRVDKLPLGRDQPFYHVLVPDGSQRYAAQGMFIANGDVDTITKHAMYKL